MASSHYKKSNSIHNHTSNKSEEAVKKFASMMIERMTALKNENWEKGWFNGVSYEGLPQNYSGRTYNASNSFMLQMLSSIENYSMPVFMTFKQAMDNGLRINKGAESFPVVYWDVNIKDANGKRIEFDDYKKLTKEERANYHVTPFLKYYPVFNVDQTNLKEVKPEKYEALRAKYSIPEIKDDQGMYTHKAIDKMISDQSWLCPINADKITPKAIYSPSRDIIVHPIKAQFKIHSEQEDIYKDGMEYYSNMLHEIAHSTGHPDRLNRENGRFGDPKYAKEELVAELTAAMISNSMGFDSRITDNSAKYLDNWLTGLKEDPKFIVSVMADVNKAAEMILEKVDEQRLSLGETPYLSKNMVAVENEYSLEPEFKPAQELIASEPIQSYYGSLNKDEKEKLNSSLVEQYNMMKEKHPDAVLLFRVEDNYMLLQEDTKIGKDILGLEISELNVPGLGNLQYSEFKHSDLDFQLPKLPRAGIRVAICETAFDPILVRPKVARGESVNTKDDFNLNNDNTMAKTKKSEEPVAEKKDEQVKVDTPSPSGEKQENNIENKSEEKTEEKKEKAVKQPREPQMVTVNGDKVSHAHVYAGKKDLNQWFFIAKINDSERFLNPVPISKEVANDYASKLISVEEMMQKYYPTKVMPKVSDEEWNAANKVQGTEGEMTIEKFNVYKETKPENANYGKFMFYTQVGDKKMSEIAKLEDLNIYFDRVQTKAQMVERIFGERLKLAAHYEQFKLPEGMEYKNISVFKAKDADHFLVHMDMGDAGKLTRPISYNDRVALHTHKIATKEQLAAKYLGSDIDKVLSKQSSIENKQEKSHSLKP